MDCREPNAASVRSMRTHPTRCRRVSFLLRFCLFCAGCYITLTSGAQKPILLPITDDANLRFTHVTFGVDSSSGRVAEIVQDDQGFLWMGTQDGLQRYDGYRLREYQHDPDNPNSLSGSYIYSLFKDREGQLWIGSDLYLDRFNPATEVFTHYHLPASSFNGWVSHITEDRDGTIWLSTNHGLNQLNPATGQTVRYRHVKGDPSTLGSNQVRATLEGKDGTFWVATTASLDIFDRRTGKVTRHFLLPVRTAANRPHSEVSLCEDHTGKIWVAFSFGVGLAAVDQAAKKLIYYSFGADSSDSANLPGIRTIFEDEDGNLWLGTADNGVVKLDRERRHFVRYHNRPNDLASLSSDQVVGMYEDHEGNIWVGTTGGGVNWFQRRPLPFTRYQHMDGNPNSLDSNYTSAIFVDHTGAMWVGSMSVLTRIDRSTGQYTFYRKAGGAGNLSSTWVISIAEDRSGYLWFGTIDGGLNRFDPHSGKFKAYRHNPDDPTSLTDDTVLALYVDHRGALWVGTEHGLCRFNHATGRFQEFKANGNKRFRYRSITEDAKGNLWLGTLESGLFMLDPISGKFTSYSHTGVTGSLSNACVNRVFVDHEGVVWAATENGLDRLDPAIGSITIFYERDGLPSSSLSSILEDNAGDLWLSTSGGLSRFNPRTKEFKNYFTSDGLPGDEFYNYASAYKSRDGEMFFNSYAGVVAFRPEDITDKPLAPPVVFTDFLLFGKHVSFSGKSPLRQPIHSTTSITLSHRQSIFSLQFAALSYASPERTLYRYKLEGLETEWNETDSTRRSATYTTLAPGSYLFRVQAHVNRGKWSEKEARLRIVVLPPWWGTWWFRSIIGLLILAVVWRVYQTRVRRVERHNRELAREEARLREHNLELDRKVAERTAQLAAANKDLESFSYSVSHDLRAPLRHINGFAGILRMDFADQMTPEARDCVEKIQHSATRMGQMVDDLLNLSRCSRGGLQRLPTDLNQLVEETRELLKPDWKGRSIQWKIGPLPTLNCDRTLMLNVFQNLLANAIKFTRQRSPAVIEVGETEYKGRAAIFVRDNGAGFDMKYADKLFGVFQRLHRADQFEGTGVGLATVQRILRRHGGEIWAEAELDQGATFYFTLEGTSATDAEAQSEKTARRQTEI